MIIVFQRDPFGTESPIFWGWLQDHQNEYFINLVTPQSGRIHRADCSHMKFPEPEKANFLKYGKLCATTRAELENYANVNRIALTTCAYCESLDGIRTTPPSGTETNTSPKTPADDMSVDLGPLDAPRRTGAELFHSHGTSLVFDLNDFWAWNVSDLVSNATRGVLAEYIVARGVGISTAGVRNEWAAYDLITPEGIKVEVKSSAYLQAWFQASFSKIQFSTRPSRAWDAMTNVLSDESKRQADVYVFALLAHRDKKTLDPMDVDQWKFFVIPTWQLDARTGSQQFITLGGIEAMCAAVGFSELRAAVEGSSHSFEPHNQQDV